jgi:hypothetical protein
MDIQTFLTNIAAFLNATVLPFIIAIAFITFLWNAFRYFILGGANPSEQEKAKTLAFWGILAFVVTLSIWGIVNMLVSGLSLRNTGVCSDYILDRVDGGCLDGSPVPVNGLI